VRLPLTSCLVLLSLLVTGLRGDEAVLPSGAERPPGWSKPVAGQPAITALAFTPDARYLLSASQKGIVQWSWPDLQPVREFPNPWLAIHGLAFSPEGNRLAIAGGEPATYGGVEVWDWPSATRLADSVAHDDVIYQIAWQPNKAGLVTVAGDRTILRWELGESLQARGPLISGHSRGVIAAVILPDSDWLVSASRDQSLRLWDLTDGSLQRTLDNHTAPVTALAARPPRPGPPWAVSCGEDRSVRFWQPTIGRMVRFARLPSIPQSVAWTGDGEHVAVGCRDGRVRLVSASGRGEVRELQGTTGWAYAIAVSPQGTWGVVAGEQGEIRVLDLRVATH